MNYLINLAAELQKELVEQLKQRSLTCAAAESCTGGLVSACITEIPGISQVFLGGAVTYTNEMKQRLLG
ncbi:MAG: CinA family protein, partial [Angelakisella sp.]